MSGRPGGGRSRASAGDSRAHAEDGSDFPPPPPGPSDNAQPRLSVPKRLQGGTPTTKIWISSRHSHTLFHLSTGCRCFSSNTSTPTQSPARFLETSENRGQGRNGHLSGGFL